MMRRLSQKLTERLVHGQEGLPEYAGQSIRYATAYLDLDEDGRPSEFRRIEAGIFHFDKDGHVQQNLINAAFEGRITYEDLEREGSKDGPVIDMSATFKRKQWKTKNRWEPGPEEINQIINFIWKPGAGTRRRKVPKKKKPVMTAEGVTAMEKIRKAVYDIYFASSHPSQDEQEAMLEKVRAIQDDDRGSHAALWKGVGDAIQAQLDERAAWRSETGTWFAIATRWTSSDASPEASGKGEQLEHVKCRGRQEAVKAARKLRKKYANDYDAESGVEVEIAPAGTDFAPE
ncbi:MAG: hypothetical protein IH994_04030 [Proteobacteria bacterium]|nr:hypothetical protein [Pseudomonadota bacterium]